MYYTIQELAMAEEIVAPAVRPSDMRKFRQVSAMIRVLNSIPMGGLLLAVAGACVILKRTGRFFLYEE